MHFSLLARNKKLYGLEYSKGDDDGNLVGFSDADWAGDSNDRNPLVGKSL